MTLVCFLQLRRQFHQGHQRCEYSAQQLTKFDRGADVAPAQINGAGTNTQQELGIPDSAKQFFADTKKSARDLARDDLIKVLTGRSAEAVNWLQDRFGLDLSKVSRLGGHSHQRTHRGSAQFPGMTM